MRILAIADHESKSLWDFFDKSKLEGIDLIISCGDLDPRYLSFLVTLSSVPVEGCICIEDTIYVHEGVRILGLGGCRRYKPGPHMYTEKEMRRRVRKLWFQLFRKKGFDILVTHAPAYELNDGEDLPHRGFYVFRELMEKYRPRYFLHGHVHMTYGRKHKRYDRYMDTHVINVYEKCEIEFEDEHPEEHIR